ncbi:5-oxoprolinase subunit PxpB [Winogradskyella sp. UBA3174]|uniref:5-oxoprolinase subunit PxpB n=1 Tax=Winogradskyella sp. UBA3174 TaxID=1947785 RepID=UPI0025E90D7A|nr:5-oxoprolinase subunit PxpB [Winogradskyella sp. UBA3174]|tara:strand:+ start:11751 stop:12473 length:723 start_codon:yes stop_codon:yes gene_type:complete
MRYNLKYSPYGEKAILIEWPAFIDEYILENILKFKFELENYYIKQKVDIINTYNSLLIIYDVTIDKLNDEVFIFKKLYLENSEAEKVKSKIWEIPVCYDDEFSTDLDAFLIKKKLSKTELIELHSNAIYTIYFLGFLPGFLYLGGLDSMLYLDRKITPNLNVKKGAVGIGGKQTGIYPKDSPGGWHIIGNSPVDFFNSNNNPPSVFKVGDKVKFSPISPSQYTAIKVKSDYKLNYFKSND